MDMQHLCHACGAEWKEHHKPGRRDVCAQCGADMHVCLNCRHYNQRYGQACSESQADPVSEKSSANFCDYFHFALRTHEGREGCEDVRHEAVNRLKRLLGD